MSSSGTEFTAVRRVGRARPPKKRIEPQRPRKGTREIAVMTFGFSPDKKTPTTRIEAAEIHNIADATITSSQGRLTFANTATPEPLVLKDEAETETIARVFDLIDGLAQKAEELALAPADRDEMIADCWDHDNPEKTRKNLVWIFRAINNVDRRDINAITTLNLGSRILEKLIFVVRAKRSNWQLADCTAKVLRPAGSNFSLSMLNTTINLRDLNTQEVEGFDLTDPQVHLKLQFFWRGVQEKQKQ